MKAYIINIGDEILIGQILNSNSAWMATELNVCGVDVIRMLTVSDEPDEIRISVLEAMENSELVLITGGLGPTKDDVTKKTLAELFETELEFHQPSFDNIVKLFQQFGREPDDRYKLQSRMPKDADVLINKIGTASGMWFERKGVVVVSMPGVPKEMIYLMTNEVLPRLQARKIIQEIVHKTCILYGRGETDLSDILEDFESSLPSHIKLAYLPNTGNGYVRLRLSGKANDREILEEELAFQSEKMQEILGNLVFGKDDDSLESVIAALLSSNKLSLSTAESCTGGKIAHKITSVAGCSSFFMGSVVAYSNEAKINLLSVNPETIEQYGAVSEETVKEMALGAQNIFNTNFAIATSGIAGPDGGTAEKPVGTVWMAIAHPNGVFCKKLKLGNNRERNIEMATNIALNSLRLLLKGELKEILKPNY